MSRKVILLKNRTTPVDPYHETCILNGLSPDFIPLLKHEHLDKAEIILFLKSALFQTVDAFIITSQRAVECLNECMELMEECDEKHIIYNKPAYTVGPATAEVLKKAGFKDIRGGSEAGNGSILADIITKDILFKLSKNIIFFTGEIRKDIIPKRLVNADFNLVERVIYRTITMEDVPQRFESSYEFIKNNEDDGHWIVFFSPQGTEGIVSFLTENQHLLTNKIRVASIGPTTEEYLLTKGIKPHVVSRKPEAKSLLESITNFE